MFTTIMGNTTIAKNLQKTKVFINKNGQKVEKTGKRRVVQQTRKKIQSNLKTI